MPGWRFALDETVAEVECGRQLHTVVWRRGKLVLCDHDLAAEVAALALGGDAPRCVQVLQAWRRARRHARFVKVDDETIRYFRTKNLPLGEQFQAALLPEPLRQLRERTTWLHAVRAGDDRHKARSEALTKAVRRVAEAALDRVVAPYRAATEVVASAKVLPRDASPRALGRPGGGRIQIAEVFLPPEWLATVGVLDLAEVDGCFILAVWPGDKSLESLDATTLRWRRTATGRLTAHVSEGRLSRVEGSWRLA